MLNPQGRAEAITGISGLAGRIFGMVPHPEAFPSSWNHPHYSRLSLSGAEAAEGGGLALFRNAVAFARDHLA